MIKKSQNSTKVQTTVVRGTITATQKKILQSLVGMLGSNEQDVVGKILTLWMYNEGFLRDSLIKKQEAT